MSLVPVFPCVCVCINSCLLVGMFMVKYYTQGFVCRMHENVGFVKLFLQSSECNFG